MKHQLDEDKPIFIQIKEQLEDSIINEAVKKNERIPSTNEFAKYYKINPATAAKGINELVNKEVLIKKRGVGMFVTEDAKSILIEERKQTFKENYVHPLISEARKLHIDAGDIMQMLEKELTT
ncbi:GntR family transcriptional regulator [Virgibacillus alimentarius]|uniref:DNA-binding transcriptional regulator YhcF (GntR family) n=1 Tax=Virgibacillus alimentarius TaxID=698769 RepID=A0ABS4SC39_9BACI|nr:MULTISPECIES: GntR family transcriptional regulator [Virgibacillus]MBP2259061.1 DNA-binding transcriptional regulator YhcF (GntR family) [Virgibacillus alimentarius]HLR67507.1 GntR family transcriptional regulator [Virgibacillus sp.]